MQELAAAIVNQALELRERYPTSAALDILDTVMEGRRRSYPRFEDGSVHAWAVDPREPFGQLLVEAFDQGRTPEQWLAMLAEDRAPWIHDALLRFHRHVALQAFATRYELWGCGHKQVDRLGAQHRARASDVRVHSSAQTGDSRLTPPLPAISFPATVRLKRTLEISHVGCQQKALGPVVASARKRPET